MPSVHYVGKAGHLAVMGELAWRGYNVAMPEIDEGDDVFIYRTSTAQTWRLQVKTSKLYQQARSRRYQFRIRESQITTPANPPVHFVFAMRTDSVWSFVVISQPVLHNYRQQNANFGTAAANKAGVTFVTLNIVTHTQGAKLNQTWCSGINISHHVNNWATWPEV